MQIQGTAKVTVDGVDIEQFCIANTDLVRHFNATLKATAAARINPHFVKLWRILNEHDQTLEFKEANLLCREENRWEVTFTIRPKTAQELAA